MRRPNRKIFNPKCWRWTILYRFLSVLHLHYPMITNNGESFDYRNQIDHSILKWLRGWELREITLNSFGEAVTFIAVVSVRPVGKAVACVDRPSRRSKFFCNFSNTHRYGARSCLSPIAGLQRPPYWVLNYFQGRAPPDASREQNVRTT